MPDSYLDNSFFHNQARVWLAPAEGLYLEQMLFDFYNKKNDIPELLIFDDKEKLLLENFRTYIETYIF
jgi:tRNA U38,U39,U40 pseudouridine synthase TruA